MMRLAAVHPTLPALRRVVKGADRKSTATTADELLCSASSITKAIDDDEERDGACDPVTKTHAIRSAVEATANGKEERGGDSEDAEDSDYDVGEECEDQEFADDLFDDSEEEDREEHRASLEAELDECADEGPDFYLKRMLAERESLEGDDAAWVDRYIALQQAWKEQHHYSIDTFDLDAALKPRLKQKQTKRKIVRKKKAVASVKTARRGQSGAKQRARVRPYSAQLLRAFWRLWYRRVHPLLPLPLKQEPAEYVLTLFVIMAFVALALAIQVYFVLRGAPTST